GAPGRAVPSEEINPAPNANPLRQRTLQQLSPGNACCLVAASSLATVTTAAVSAAVTSAAAATRRPLLARPCLIHSHRPPIHGVAVEFRDSILRFLLRTHRHKGEPTEFPRESVLHTSNSLTSPTLQK